MSIKEKLSGNLSSLDLMRLLVAKHNFYVKFKPKYKFSGFLNEYNCELEDIFATNEYRLSNDFYGIASSIKKYSNRERPLHAFIEHGLYFGSYVNQEEINGSMPMLITFSKNRKNYIRQVSKIPVLAIGPYIVYSRSYYDDSQVKELKKKYGKVLLVFPQHTIDGVVVQSNFNKFFNTIIEIKKNGLFDNVFVSLYYKNATSDAVKFYKEQGMIPICAGHRQDPDFLARQKSFILLSDLTISDNVGTHVGYCTALGKKHIIFDSDNKIFAENDSAKIHVPELYLTTAAEEKEIVKRCFSETNNINLRKDILNRYWGADCKLTSNEMHRVFEFCDTVYKASKGKFSCEIYRRCMKSYPDISEILEECIR